MDTDVSNRRIDLFWALLSIGSVAFQVLIVLYTPLDLSPDEAHYWEWSQRLDWSYYSKGPLVAYLIYISTALLGDCAWAVRLPAIMCSNVMLVVLYVFVRREYSSTLALWAWLTLRTMLIFASQGYAMTTDPPAALCWLVGIVCAYYAVQSRKGTYWWMLLGISIGVGVLAKYTVGLLYPAVFLFLCFTPTVRFHLRTKEFWMGVLAGGVCLVPILIWNQQNGWVNLAHNVAHLTPKHTMERFSDYLNVRYLLELIGGQLGLVGPVFLFWFGFGLWKSVKVWRDDDYRVGLFLWSSLPLLLLCVAVSLVKRVYANWPMPIYIGGLLVVVHLVHAQMFKNKTIKRAACWSIGINITLTCIAYLLVMGVSPGVPGTILPTKKLDGWSSLGVVVDRQIEEYRSIFGRSVSVLAADYGTASEVAFYAKKHPRVYCAVAGSRRMNQYDVWGGWEDLQGQDMIVVLKNNEHFKTIQNLFERIEPLGIKSGETTPNLEIIHHESHIRDFRLYLGHSYQGGVPYPPVRR